MRRRSLRTSGSAADFDLVNATENGKQSKIRLRDLAESASGSKREALRKRLQTNSLASAFLCSLIFFLSYVENEHSYLRSYDEDVLCDVLRTVLLVLSLCQVLLVLQHHRDWIGLQSTTGRVHPDSCVWRVQTNRLLLELALHCLVLPPMANSLMGDQLLISVRPADWLFLLMLLRGYHLLRVLYWFSPHTGPRVDFYCSLHGVARPFLLSLKSALLARSPVSVLSVWMAMSGSSAVSLHVFERECDWEKDRTFWSSLWAEISVQTLTGYGDTLPCSSLGKLVVVPTIFLGTFAFALLLHIGRKRLALDAQQSQLAQELLFVVRSADKLEPAAATLIQRCWRHSRSKRRSSPRVFSAAVRVARHTQCFSLSRRAIRAARCAREFKAELLWTMKDIQRQLTVFVTRTLKHKDFFQSGFSAHLLGYSNCSQSLAVFESAKQCRKMFMDSRFGPDYRERRSSCFSQRSSQVELGMAQRNSAVPIEFNLRRLRSIMAQEKSLRLLAGHGSLGHSPRVSFEALRGVRDEKSSRWEALLRAAKKPR